VKDYVFKLYISGEDSINNKTITNLKGLCDTYIKNAYELSIIDIDEFPEIAEKTKIIAVPTLVKERPTPVQKFIGDISETDDLRLSLGLAAAQL